MWCSWYYGLFEVWNVTLACDDGFTIVLIKPHNNDPPHTRLALLRNYHCLKCLIVSASTWVNIYVQKIIARVWKIFSTQWSGAWARGRGPSRCRCPCTVSSSRRGPAGRVWASAWWVEYKNIKKNYIKYFSFYAICNLLGGRHWLSEGQYGNLRKDNLPCGPGRGHRQPQRR